MRLARRLLGTASLATRKQAFREHLASLQLNIDTLAEAGRNVKKLKSNRKRHTVLPMSAGRGKRRLHRVAKKRPKSSTATVDGRN